MKRILCLTLALLMLFAFTACKKGETAGENIPEDNNIENAIGTAPDVEDAPAEPDAAPEEESAPSDEGEKAPEEANPPKKDEATTAPKPSAKPQAPATPPAAENTPAEPPVSETPETAPENSAPESGADSLGNIMLGVWKANRDKSPQEIADACISNEAIQFFPMTTPVEAGFFAEFGGDIDGFTSAVKFGPMMGSIAFSGFVFEVPSDADSFAKKLRDSADPRWNICVEAEEIICDTYGNKVFFLMCPKSLGE